MPSVPDQVWFLHEWFASTGHKQNDLNTQLDWPKSRMHRIWHGLQPFRADDLAEVAAFLNVRPHELLMPPEEAMRIRRMQATLAEVAENLPRSYEPPPATAEAARTGTKG